MEVPIIKFKIFEPYAALIRHGISTRNGGTSQAPFDSLNLAFDTGDEKIYVLQNYKIFCDALGIEMDKIVHPSPQGHTDKVLLIEDDGTYNFHSPPCSLDGFITDVPGIPLLVRFADCQGIFMIDPVKKVIAAVHCGWKGNAQNIIGKCVQKMMQEKGCNPADIRVGISPSLGPESTEFTDPFNELPEHMHKFINGDNVDLWACSMEQLKAEGILPQHVENVRRDTMKEPEIFFSYRGAGGAEGKTGRMAGVIMLEA